MYQIHYLNSISPKGTALWTENYIRTEQPEKAQAILVRSAAMHDMPFSDSLLAVARAGAGVNNIPVDKIADELWGIYSVAVLSLFNLVPSLCVAFGKSALPNVTASWARKDIAGSRFHPNFEAMVRERAQSKYADRMLRKKKIAEESARIARLNEEKRKAQQKEAERKEAERQAFIRAKTKELEIENRGIEHEIIRYHELNRKCSLNSNRMSLCNNLVNLLESIEKSSQLSESMAFYNEVVKEKQTIEIKVNKVAILYKNIGNDFAAEELLNRLS